MDWYQLYVLNLLLYKLMYRISFMLIFISLYKEKHSDGTQSGVKWTCPNIHDLKNTYGASIQY